MHKGLVSAHLIQNADREPVYFGWAGADENKRARWLVAAPEYFQPLQVEASTVRRDKEKLPSLWLLRQEGKRRLECVCPTVQLSGDFLKN